VINFTQKLWHRRSNPKRQRLSFSRPLVVLQSDDWGRVGVRDREGYEQLRASGIRLGEHPYDFYTLETAEDVTAISDLLKRHRDTSGRRACLVMNFILGNLNFAKTAKAGFRELHLLPLTRGLPGHWKRPGLFDAYGKGIEDGVFFPALHGLTHFCRQAVEHALFQNAERSTLLKTCWKAETPYIYWRMPWIGYEYRNPEKPHAGFLESEVQANLIRQAAAYFKKLFSASPASACAPGYRANADTHAAWSECGVRVAQNGSGVPLPPYMDERGILNLHRMIDFEPSQRGLPTEKYLELAEDCFARGIPAVISMHSINFHSSLRDFRGPTLRALDELLSSLERKHPNLLYVHDGDLYEIVNRGKYKGEKGMVFVDVKQTQLAKSAARGAH
jgi:hypothetical protein